MDFSEKIMMECMNYTFKEFEMIENHLASYIGDIDTIIYSKDEESYFGHIAIINPTEKYNFYTLITLGKDRKHSRKTEQIEFVICLPANWNFKSQSKKWMWPFDLLQEIKAYQLANNIEVDVGTVFNNRTSSNYIMKKQFDAIFFTPLSSFPTEVNICKLNNNKQVKFLNIFLLYENEREYMYQTSYMSFWYLMTQNSIKTLPVNVERCNLVPNKPRQIAIPLEKQKYLLKDWQDVDGCLASDEIIFEGKTLKLMYREEPVASWDSGWRFSAKVLFENINQINECFNEMHNIENIYHLNTICNYEPSIISLLRAPVGSVFCRNDDGDFIYFNLDDLIFNNNFWEKDVTLLN